MSTKRFIARFGLDNNNQTITNVANPVNSTDVATKSVTDGILAFAQAAFDSANNVFPQVKPAYDTANTASANTVYLQNDLLVVSATANTKVFQFFQNTAPAIANTHDIWRNSDTGVVYENWGTPASPVWAESGPTGLSVESGVFSSIVISANTIYANGVDLLTFSQAAFNKANNSSSNTVYLFGALNQTNTNIVDANTQLKSYTDGAIASANTQLKAYTDNLVSSSNTQLKSYTDGLVSSANTQLKSYTDGLISYNSGVNTTQNTNIQSAWNVANNALSNTGGTITGNLTISGNTTINKQLFVNYNPTTTSNSAIEITAANTKGGNGYADVLMFRNTSGGATNPNKTLRLNNTGGIEVIDSNYGNNIFMITDGGNVSSKGTITPGAYSPGQVIKDTMLSNSEVTVVSTTIAPSGTNTNFITYNYTPVSASSYLVVHFHLSRYEPQGTTDDSWFSILSVDGTEISYSWQMVNDNGTGTSGRSGVLFPLTGRYTNSSTSTKQIQVAARRDAADDSIIITNSSTAIWLRITEIAR